jgi:hypothetical protein
MVENSFMEFDFQTAKLAVILAITNLATAVGAFLLITWLDTVTALAILVVLPLTPIVVQYALLKKRM